MDQVHESDSDASGDIQFAAPRRDVKDVLGGTVTEFDKWGPGVHYDMPEDVYHSIPAISNTALKHSRRSFRHFEYYIQGGEFQETPSMVFGRIGHRALLEHQRFLETCVFSDFKDKRAKGYQAAVKANPDKYVLTVKEAAQLTAMFEELARNEACMEYIKEGRAEVTILAIDPLTKMRLKCRIDWVSTNKPFIVDYKTTEDARPTEIPEKMEATAFLRSSKFEINSNAMGYENQAAFYLYLCKLAGVNAKYFALLAQEKKPPFVPCPYVYGFETLEEAAEENRQSMNRIFDAIQSGKFPGYADKPVVLARPSFARKP